MHNTWTVAFVSNYVCKKKKKKRKKEKKKENVEEENTDAGFSWIQTGT